MNNDIYDMIDEVKSKTICSDFDTQLDAVESVFGYNIIFYFDKKDVDALLDGQDLYSDEIKERVRDILYQRIRKFQYLFKS
jgi:hypothetical protein